jgi:hypothetical protein
MFVVFSARRLLHFFIFLVALRCVHSINTGRKYKLRWRAQAAILDATHHVSCSMFAISVGLGQHHSNPHCASQLPAKRDGANPYTTSERTQLNDVLSEMNLLPTAVATTISFLWPRKRWHIKTQMDMLEGFMHRWRSRKMSPQCKAKPCRITPQCRNELQLSNELIN